MPWRRSTPLVGIALAVPPALVHVGLPLSAGKPLPPRSGVARFVGGPAGLDHTVISSRVATASCGGVDSRPHRGNDHEDAVTPSRRHAAASPITKCGQIRKFDPWVGSVACCAVVLGEEFPALAGAVGVAGESEDLGVVDEAVDPRPTGILVSGNHRSHWAISPGSLVPRRPVRRRQRRPHRVPGHPPATPDPAVSGCLGGDPVDCYRVSACH